MSSKTFKFAVVSDVHLGHPRTPTHHTLSNLRAAFNRETGLPGLDVLFIAGDLFDGLLPHNAEETQLIHEWMVDLLRTCRDLGVELRVLEGTPSHDYGQNAWFVTANRSLSRPCALQYVDTLSVEYFAAWDIHVLYVPDKWRYEAIDTYLEAVDLLQAKGLTTVDLAIMHGSFDYQMPKSAGVHDTQQWLRLVDELICIGHVHTHTHYEHIVAQGSFDRGSHGEEEPKGYIQCQLYPTQWYFVENPGAKQYITVDVRHLSLEDTLSHLRDLLQHPSGTAVRLHMQRHSDVHRGFDAIKKQFPQYVWSSLIDGELQPVALVDDDVDDVQAVTLGPQNLVDHVLRELPVLSPELQLRVRELLELHV